MTQPCATCLAPARRRPPAAIALAAAVLAVVAAASPALGVYDMRFDVATFNATPEGSADHFNQTLFDRLNFRTVGGHVIAMGSDAHRPELTSAGNTLGAYYNSWTNLYNNQPVGAKDGNAAADAIHAYVANGFVSNGPRPTWVVLNELSGSLWPSNATYRQWTIDTVTRLHDVYGYEVIAYSPFPNPAQNDVSWQALSAKAYVGIEYYLSGEEVRNQGYSLSWVQAQYQSSKTSYRNRGVPDARMILGEHFGHTTAGTGWGRAGVTIAEWEQAIRVRSQAIHNVGFAGFIGYAWSKNGMGVSDAEMLAAESAYRSSMVVRTETPQWVSTAGGSWGTRNNWLALTSVPDAPGAVAAFHRNTTAAATVTLDAPTRTVGTLRFASPNAVTVSPGSGVGGTLVLDNGGASAVPVLDVQLGSHTLNVPVSITGRADLAVTSGASLKLAGAVTGRLRTLSIAGTGRLDIGSNKLVIDHDAGTSPAAAVRASLSAAWAGGVWNGVAGLTSSVAAADSQRRLAVGYADAASLGRTTFAAQPLDGTCLLVRVTWYGDANLDGLVDADDYSRLDRGYAMGLNGWADGDFDYSGAVNANDYLLIDRAVALQSGTLPSPDLLATREAQFGLDYVSTLLAAVPEPAFVTVLPAVLPLAARRRRRAPSTVR